MRGLLPAALLIVASAGAGEDARERVLARVAGASAAVKDLTADYEQQTLREGLTRPAVSRGSLLYRMDPERGGEVLMKVVEPEKAFIRITASRMETYLPQDAQVEVVDLPPGEAGSHAVEATVLLYGKPRAYWEERFEIAVPDKAKPEDADEVVLVPRDPALRKTLLEIRMSVPPDRDLPERVRYRYARGEEVTLIFGRLKVNRGLAARDLVVEYPEGTEILRPGGS